MKLLKKCGLLCLLAMALLTMSAAACGDGVCVRLMEGTGVYVDEIPGGEEIELLANIGGAEAALAEGMRQMKEEIDISSYGLSEADLGAVMNGMATNYPELFHMGHAYGYTMTGSGIIIGVNPTYTMTKAQYEDAMVVYEKGVADIVAQVKNSWTDLEKVLFVHDYLAANFEYDLTYQYYDAYHFFKLKTGVCEAYTETFVAVMKELGIDVSWVISAEIVHIWNLVKLDGKWYHLDATHDDPTHDRLGYVSHDNFLLSDDAMLAVKMTSTSSTSRGDWVYGASGTVGSDYDAYFWQDARSPFVEANGTWYYVDVEGLKTWDGVSNGEAAEKDTFGTVPIGGKSWYDKGGMAGLSAFGGKLYYNSMLCVKSYDLGTGEVNVLETVDDPTKSQIEGLRVDDGVLKYQELYYSVGEAPSYSEIYSVDIRPFVSVDGVYSYHVEDGKVELNVDLLPANSQVLIVSYNNLSGAFMGAQICDESKVYDLPKGKVVLFAMNGVTGSPLCKKAEL